MGLGIEALWGLIGSQLGPLSGTEYGVGYTGDRVCMSSYSIRDKVPLIPQPVG